ncbi:5-formyltetrahydrofolate cyclo-ligase [Bagarius yarrelli]|uniref:5-formyltetrahydrofolate cyclo-ligase n=1 Tax=Bagarius yarrelli TaxID=175774 RepID=A0A556TSL4_BAGYA|nr:5-formyltetrahydrofolate cyclo-ligase [Bagarius yarrelli]
MAALRAAKQALRKEIKKRVAALSNDEKLRQSHIVSQKLFKHPSFISSHRVAVFLSMHDEICTEAILQHVLSSGKVCFIPGTRATATTWTCMLRLNSMEDMNSLPVTSWNIRQPADTMTH